TVRLLLRRRLAVLGSGVLAGLLFLGFAAFGYGKLKQAVLDEADYWTTGANNLARGAWSPPFVAPVDDSHQVFSNGGTNLVEVSGRPTLIQYHVVLAKLVQQKLEDRVGGWIFKPISWAIPG